MQYDLLRKGEHHILICTYGSTNQIQIVCKTKTLYEEIKSFYNEAHFITNHVLSLPSSTYGGI